MKTRVRKSGGVSIVDLDGRLILGDGDQLLRETIDDLLARGERRLVLNLAALQAIDSSGVGEIVESKKVAEGVGAKLKLLIAHGRVKHVLDATLLLPAFESFEDEAAAVASFA